MRYFYGSTRLDGHAFDYHAAPIAILKGRVIAFGLYVVYAIIAQVYPTGSLLVLIPFAFILPWVVMRSRKFHMRMSSWRGLRFDFHGDYPGALKAYTGWLLAAIATVIASALLDAQMVAIGALVVFAMAVFMGMPILALTVTEEMGAVRDGADGEHMEHGPPR